MLQPRNHAGSAAASTRVGRALGACCGAAIGAALLTARPLPAWAQETAPPPAEPAPAVGLRDYEAVYLGLQVGFGAGIPVGEPRGLIRGAGSFLVNGELDVDLGTHLQLGARATVLLPGIEVEGRDVPTSAASMLLQARFFPIAFGSVVIMRPYVGGGPAYSFLSVGECSTFGCSDEEPTDHGFSIVPFAGMRGDIPVSRGDLRPAGRLISMYAELGYQKTFWITSSNLELDRVFFMLGAGVTL